MRFLRSLTAQLVLLAVAVALPLAGLAGYLAYRFVQDAREQAMSLVGEVARDVAQDSVAFVARTEEHARYLAQRPGVRAVDARRCDPVIIEIARMDTTYTAISLTDARGRAVCSSLGDAGVGIHYDDREWFQRALTGSDFRAGAPVLGRATGELIVPLTLPVMVDDSAVAGVLIFAMRTTEITRLVEARRLPERSVVTVVSEDGTVIARSLDPGDWVGRDARRIPALAAGMAQREGIAVLEGVDGVERFHAFTTIPALGWLVSAAVPVDAVMGPYHERLARTALAAAAAIAAAVVLAAWLSRRIRRPVRSLAAAVNAVAHGDYGRPALESGPVEVVAVAHAFNAMAQARAAAEAGLKQRTTQLEAANKELEAFAYSVSHDLRAPLRAIDGFSQAVLDDYREKLDGEGQELLQRVRGAAQHMAELIDGLLRLSRLTRGDMDVAEVDLSAVAERVMSVLRAAAPAREVEVAIAPQVTARGDRRLLEAAMENLLANAWKFTAKTEHPRIEFEARRENGELVCDVRDNGAGFDMAFADKLFVPFQRLHAATEFPGNGIGLATVRRIVARHGGRVWAEAAPGRGASFHFALPAGGA